MRNHIRYQIKGIATPMETSICFSDHLTAACIHLNCYVLRCIKHFSCMLFVNKVQSINQYLPAPILAIFNANGGEKKHKYQTRNKAIPNIQKHQSNLFSNSFLCGSIRQYMKLNGIMRKSLTFNHYPSN